MRILPHTDPFLRTKAKPVEKITPEVLENIEKMLRLMHEDGGVGLAATQVGWNARVFVMNDRSSRERWMDMVWVNPRLKLGVETVLSTEGCLSVKDENDELIYGKVLRSSRVTITGVGLSRADRGPREGKLCFLALKKHDEDPVQGSMHECDWEFESGVEWPGGPVKLGPFIVQHETDHLNGVIFTDKLVRA